MNLPNELKPSKAVAAAHAQGQVEALNQRVIRQAREAAHAQILHKPKARDAFRTRVAKVAVLTETRKWRSGIKKILNSSLKSTKTMLRIKSTGVRTSATKSNKIGVKM